MSARIPNATPAATRPTRTRSLLAEIEYRFRLAGQGPAPLSVDGRVLGHGLPRRPIALVELSAILMHPSCSAEASDAAWRLLVTLARTGAERWIVGAVGVALPGLRGRAAHLRKLSGGDVESVLLTHFLAALSTVDLTGPAVLNSLLNTAFSKARGELDKRQPAAEAGTAAPSWRQPGTPGNHPDIALIRAVRAGVITAAEADLIGATYLEKLTVGEYAKQVGRSYWQVYRQRAAAVQRLVAAIESGELSDDDADVIAEATMTTAPEDTLG